MDNKIIELFKKVQNVPYYCLEYRDSEKLFDENKGCCLEKTIWLDRELNKVGIETKFYSIKFNWSELPIPVEIIKLRKDPMGEHLALKAKIGNRWIWIDPTWDPPLAKAGFPVTINWNGKDDTKLAVKPIEINETIPKDKITVTTNQEFFNALNDYLDKVREGKREMEIRIVKEKDFEKLQEIDKEYYDGWNAPIKVFKNWFETFPEGFFVAEEKGEIIAYIFVELLNEHKVVPFMHDAKTIHNPNGKYMNISGLGILKKYKNTNIGEKLIEKIIELAKSKGCKQILFIIGEEAGIGGHDSYERDLATKTGFIKENKIEKWEIEPGYFVTDHWMWIKNL